MQASNEVEARPKGSTNKAKEEHEENKEKATAWAAKRLKLLTKDPTKVDKNGKWKHGVIKALAIEVQKKFNLNERDVIKPDTIHQGREISR
jgi:hypothetical protein